MEVKEKQITNRRESVVSFASDLNDDLKKPKYISDNMAIMWQNLTYYGKTFSVRKSNNSSAILWQLNGQLNFGTLNGLMGASGAGKTTLLRCINGVDRSGLSDTTHIYLNKNKQIYPCFVVQDIKEHLLMSLTVRESLMYASLLKNSGQTRIAKLMNHSSNGTSRRKSIIEGNIGVEKLVIDLMLNDCIDTKISRCSGGEQKRVVIAMELTAQIKPNLICIDEPTSGLDSNSAEQTVLCLQNIARKHNLAIVTSIHQPNSDVLMMFDKLYVLSKGGHCVYFGAPIDLRQHLSECHIQCNQFQTPIEVLLKVCSNFNKNAKRNKSLENKNSSLGLSDELSVLISKTNENMRSMSDMTNRRQSFGTFTDIDRVFSFHDTWYLLKRSILYSWIRQWKVNAFMFILFVSFSISMSILYSTDIGKDANCLNIANITIDNCVNTYTVSYRQESLMDQNLKFLFFMCLFISFMYLTISILIFPPEIKIFLNEHRNRWYSTGSYYCAKTITEIPLLLIFIYFYCWVGYYGTSQIEMNHWYNGIIYSSKRFPLFLIVFVLTLLNTQGLSMFASILFPTNQHIIQIVSIGIYITMIFFCGFFIPLNNLPNILRIVSHTSFIKLNFHLILIIIYGRNRCIISGTDPLALIIFDINEDDFWFNIYCFLGNLLFWRIIPLLLLLIQANPDWFTKSKSNNSKTETNGKDREMSVWTNDAFSDRL